MDSYNVIKSPGEGEIEEKKSRFIGHAVYVSDEEEALRVIELLKKKYWDARHNCFAYVVGERGEIQRFSDDGEPGGTAGRPILEVINGENLRNVLVVVTRYFGGTLLGTGGLVRAYTSATKECIAAADVRGMVYAKRIGISVDYTAVGKLQYFFAEENINIEATNYTDKVEFVIVVDDERANKVIDEVTSLTNGKCEISIIDTGFFMI